MLSRFSVKRPFVIIVAVIVAMILGGVSLTRMPTDLLPNLEMPYLAVIATDPGASAEKVEEEVTEPLEGALSTVNGVNSVQSISSDNFSMVFLEFADGTDMDSAMVKVSSAVNEVSPLLPETAGTPNIMEISMDMMATMYITATYDDHDIYRTSELVEDDIDPAIERIDGVADVSLMGLVDKSVEVRLSDSKIEDVNNKVLGEVNDQLYDAKKEIDKGKKQIKDAEKKLKKAKSQLEDKRDETYEKLGDADSQLSAAVSGATTMSAAYGAQVQAYQAQLQSLQTQLDPLQAQVEAKQAELEAATTEEEKQAIQAEIDTLNEEMAPIQAQADALKTQLDEAQKALDSSNAQLAKAQEAQSQATTGSLSAVSGFSDASTQIAIAESTLASSKSQLKTAESQYKESRKTALKNANINKLVDKTTLAQLIKAQNFSMPAGYVDDDSDNQWLLRVGEDLTTVEDLENLMLTHIDGVGDIRLIDVADIVSLDNVGDSYAKVNGKDAIVLSVFKNSTASTSDVSNRVLERLDKLESEHEGLHLDVLSNQGAIIGIYISTILQSLLLGALLAIVVLALFLRDWKPTLIVAFSIPFSVLLALVFMYFTGIGLNIMSLGGLSLAIGMLVDNSIIIMENIYRLRARGISAARAAVQGAKQLTGAVIASTLTTICVFLPIIFTTGMVNQLLLPFSLTIAYVLCASLLVALTLVPAVSSFVFKNYVPRTWSWFAHVQNGYDHSLRFFLRHKSLPLVLAVVLLGGAVYGVTQTGISMIPDMTSRTISINLDLEEGTTREEAYQMGDDAMDALMEIEGVKLVGAMDGTASVSMVSAAASSSNSEELVDFLTFYVQPNSDVDTEAKVRALQEEINVKLSEVTGLEITTDSSSQAMSALQNGLSLTLKGKDQDKLIELSEQVMAAIDEVEGYEEIENGMEDADSELHLIIDRDKLTDAGYTVAQLYADLSSKLQTTADSTEMTVDGYNVDVTIVDETNPITKENLLNTKIEIDKVTESGTETKTYKLKDFATIQTTKAATSVRHENGSRVMTVTAEVAEGYNNALLARELQTKLDALDLPDGYSIETGGELENINTMLEQMMLLLILGFVLIYLIMVAQFQSLLSPFIIILTVPLAFTGGFLGLLAGGEQLTLLSLMGFAVLMGTVVNNGIVFVDYVNQLRIGGLDKHDALAAAGRTRMRPIVMTALTTILAMLPMVLSQAIGASMERGMALVVVGGLLYATFMTLYVVPIMYDLLYRKQPHEVDLGDESVDDDPGDAQAYLDAIRGRHAAPALAGEVASLPTEEFEVTDDKVLARAEDRAMRTKRHWFKRRKMK